VRGELGGQLVEQCRQAQHAAERQRDALLLGEADHSALPTDPQRGLAGLRVEAGSSAAAGMVIHRTRSFSSSRPSCSVLISA
jgi:hypothetical protein